MVVSDPNPPRRLQEPSPPFPYEQEQIAYENPGAGMTLAGTLTKPGSGGPHPAAVLITGSGPHDRDETVFGHRPFLVLADQLTRHGVAVLRADDRGVGESTGDLYAHWGHGDFRSGRELLEPDVEFNLGAPDYEATPAHGPDQIEQQMREFLANWTDYRVEAEEFLDAGDSVLVRGRQRGLGKQSGVEVDAPPFGVWAFRQGKIVRIGFYFGEREAREAAGLLRPVS